MSSIQRPFKISVLVFVHDGQGRQLLLQRAKEPNKGMWSPIGGKLEMATGESPFECAIRETKEEIDLTVTEADLHLFAMISEKDYEGSGHWLMFLFDCRKPVDALPASIDEGVFAFFTPDELSEINLPATDREALWPIFEQYRGGFVALRALCDPTQPLRVTIEEATPGPGATLPSPSR
jgi:8-oxo-dGTP diphosphatase